MAELHPNDIGLATFCDVGDVTNLKTTSKEVVGAINEIYQTGGSGTKIFGTQFYIDGENNVIFGENNTVYGNNNLIIGSDNTIVGDNHTIIQSGKTIYQMNLVSINTFDIETKTATFSFYEDVDTVPFDVGDTALVGVAMSWTNEDWSDWVYTDIPPVLTKITDIDIVAQTITLDELDIPTGPPDEIHTICDYSFLPVFIAFNKHNKINVSVNGSINMGETATGGKSVALNYGVSSGSVSFAANNGEATANYSAAVNMGRATKNNAFGTNRGLAEGENATAVNQSYCFNPYAFASGYSCRVYGKVLKCTAFNPVAKSLTLEAGQSTANMVGKKVIIRSHNNGNKLFYRGPTVTSVSGQTLYFKNDNFYTGSDPEKLLPGNVAFLVDSTTSYAQSNFVGGYEAVAAGKYTFAHGRCICALHENSVIFGKFGLTDSDNGLFLANGTTSTEPGLAFKALSDGSVHADGAYTSPCADYAEYFEWSDGNPDNEDRTGLFVKLDGDKIAICDEFDDAVGIVSAMPAIVGDSGEMHWHDKFVTDDFGRVQYHDVLVPAEVDEDGNIIVEEHMETQPVISPDWNRDEEYIPRNQRPEWAAVGVLGKIIAYDDGTLRTGDKCRCGKNGRAVKADKSGYSVLRRVSDDKVLIWVR